MQAKKLKGTCEQTPSHGDALSCPRFENKKFRERFKHCALYHSSKTYPTRRVEEKKPSAASTSPAESRDSGLHPRRPQRAVYKRGSVKCTIRHGAPVRIRRRQSTFRCKTVYKVVYNCVTSLTAKQFSAYFNYIYLINRCSYEDAVFTIEFSALNSTTYQKIFLRRTSPLK